MILPDQILKRLLKEFDGDTVKVFLYHAYFGESIDLLEAETYLDIDQEDIREIEEDLKKAKMWGFIEKFPHLSRFAQEYDKYISGVSFAFGITRDLSEDEFEYVNGWFFQMKYSMELVVYACMLTREQTGGAAFAYADKILLNWEINDIESLDDLNAVYKIHRGARLKKERLQIQARKLVNSIMTEWKEEEDDREEI